MIANAVPAAVISASAQRPVEDQVQQLDLTLRFWNALRTQLTPKTFQVFLAYLMTGRNQIQIADEYGCSRQAVQYHLDQAQKKLSRYFNEEPCS